MKLIGKGRRKTEQINEEKKKAYYHLPGLFEFCGLYEKYLPLYFEHRDWFYEWCGIGSVYGAPEDCIWGGGRTGYGDCDSARVRKLFAEYGISMRLTFSNMCIRKEHLGDRKCNALCEEFENTGDVQNGIIITSDLLLDHIKEKYPGFYFVSSTTKVITDFGEFLRDMARPEYRYAVPDFRFNNRWDMLDGIPRSLRPKAEFLCNECCDIRCSDRKKCYENVSLLALGTAGNGHVCRAPYGKEGYVFSRAMESPAFISTEDITEKYLRNGFTEFKIEGRSLGSALILEILLHYMVKPEYRLRVRENIYLDANLDLF